MFQSVAGLVGNPSIETLLRLKRAVGDQSRFGSNIEETGRVESNCQRSSRTGATCHNKLRYEPRLPMLCEDFENGGAASDDEMMTFELLTPRSPITPTKTLPGEHYVSGMEKSVAEDDCDRQDDFEDD